MIPASLMSATPAPDDSLRATPPVNEGDVLASKYRVERVLGQGGMGIVVAATHTTLHQRVALKFLLPAALSNPETIERFLREARAAVRLKSEHAAKVVDVGTLDSGLPYMVMEYLDGATLGQIVRQKGAIPTEEAVDYVLQACEAVAEAHAAGIVHRDLKPENLFLTKRVDGQPLVKVLDFGIAKTQTPGDGLALTRTSTVIGSPLYMPPEQLRAARNADTRSDIWALGAVLFELVTGRVPFQAESFSELCFKVAQDPAQPPSALRADVPPGLDAVVLRCLEKEPARRFQNVADLAASLEPLGPPHARELAQRVASVLGGGKSTSVPALAQSGPSGKVMTGTAWGNTSTEARSRKLTWIVAGAAAAMCLVAGGLLLLGHHDAPPAAAATSSAAASSPPTLAPSPAAGPVVSLAATVDAPAPSVAAPPAQTIASAAPAAAARALPPKSHPAVPKALPTPKKDDDGVVFQRK